MKEQKKELWMDRYEIWLASDKVDQNSKDELLSLKDNVDEIKQRFTSYLSFGTAGLRGVMAAGTNNMNIYTVRHATQGFAEYIKSQGKSIVDRGCVICYDSRLNSKMFAEAAASVLAENGIHVYLFDELRPTPELSFAIRYLGAAAGINITASHNPKQYNGYKAYWEDGAQLSPEQADAVSAAISKIDIFDGIRGGNKADFDSAVADGRIGYIGDEVDERFLENVLKQPINSDVVKNVSDKLKIVYTPLHGAGTRLVPEAMRRLGVTNLYTVDEQMQPDGNFPTAAYPNPEFPEVFELAIKLADEKGADVIIANDPDADRTGVMIRNDEGKFITLTGNQIGVLLLEYIISAEEEFGTMPKNPFAVKTIVSTDLAAKICEERGIKLHDVLTGFKFIGGVISDYEREGGQEAANGFLLGFEESNGYLKGTYARDKDAVCATVMFCELTAYYLSHGKTIFEALNEMYSRYGLYREETENIYMEGIDGIDKMSALMTELRENPPSEIGGQAVVEVRDYQKDLKVNLLTGEKTKTGLPISNVLYYVTDRENKIIIRPSGTEPKIKVYLLLHSNSGNSRELDEMVIKIKKTTSSWVK